MKLNTLVLIFLVLCYRQATGQDTIVTKPASALGSILIYQYSTSCEDRGAIIFNKSNSQDRYALSLVSKEGRPIPNVQFTDSTILNIPSGFFDFYILDATSNRRIDSVLLLNFRLRAQLIYAHACTDSVTKSLRGDYKVIKMSQGIAPFSILVKTNNSTRLIKTTSNKIFELLDTFDLTAEIAIADQCQDTLIFNRNSVAIQEPSITYESTCAGPLGISFSDFRRQDNAPLPGLNYKWLVDSMFISDSSKARIEAPKLLSKVVLTLDYPRCQKDYFSIITDKEIKTIDKISIQSSKPAICSDGQIVKLSVQTTNKELTYTWNTGSLDSILNVNDSGTYKVIVSNKAGCIDSASVNIKKSVLQVIPTVTNNLCFGEPIAKITLEVSGGIGNLRYTWQDSVFTKDRFNLLNGAYRVVISDEQLCKLDTTLRVSSPPALTLSYTAWAASCAPAKDGRFTSSVTGGLPPYKVQWSNGLTVYSVDTLSVGNYTITVTDSNNCTTVWPFGIDDLSPLLGFRVDTLCAGGQVTVGNKIYNRSGTYIDSLKSYKGCDSIHTTIVFINPQVDFTIKATDPTCNGANDGKIELTNVTGVPAYRYFLNNSEVGFSQLNNISPGNYILKVTDRFNCSKEKGLAITNPEKVSFTLGRDTFVQLGDTLRINALSNLSTSRIKSIQWTTSPSEGNCTACSTLFEYKPTQDHKLTARLESTTGCIVESSILVKVNLEFKAFVPNVFSPSSSNESNQRLTVYAGRSVQRINYLRVYNRFGTLVFESRNFTPNDLQAGWDGTFKGVPVPSGVYAYIAEVVYSDGRTGIIKGAVTLIR